MAFSTRIGGVSAPPFDAMNLGRSTEDSPDAVAENRRRFLHRLGLDPERLATAGQVHGARVVEVHGPGHTPSCDALWTRTTGLALAVTAADCLPLLLYAPGVVAAAHAGWRGIAADLPARTVDVIRSAAGVHPADMRAALGPCIRGCCYEVGPEVADRFVRKAVTTRGRALHLDLVIAVRDQLLAAGIREEAIVDGSVCTSCEADRCFSHRRDRGRTGRLWGVAALRHGEPGAGQAHKRAKV
jgi:YfiH family protein